MYILEQTRAMKKKVEIKISIDEKPDFFSKMYAKGIIKMFVRIPIDLSRQIL